MADEFYKNSDLIFYNFIYILPCIANILDTFSQTTGGSITLQPIVCEPLSTDANA
jgi:hypothetical protein